MKKNIAGVAICKAMSIFISLLIVPITIDYVTQSGYGIWLTLSSMISWLSFFDIGINNGLRNKLAESIVKRNSTQSRELISTTYALLILIFIPLMLVLLFVNQLIPWYNLLNLSPESVGVNIYIVVAIVIISFCIRLILSTISIILLADLKTAQASLIVFMEQILSLIIIWGVGKWGDGNLITLSLILCFTPLIVQLFFSIYYFRKHYLEITPCYSFINFKVGKSILSVGGRFFVIQVSSIVLFQSSSFIIMRDFGANEVTEYNIAYKYFSILLLLMNIFISPLWSMVTEANVNKDYQWIKNSIKKYIWIASLLVILGIIMLAASPIVFTLWLGDSINIPFKLSFFLLIFNIISLYGSIFCSVLNGLTILKQQYYASLFSPIIFILSYYILSHILELGVVSIILAILLSNFNAYLIAPFLTWRFTKEHQ